jgi:hypothetical protein
MRDADELIARLIRAANSPAKIGRTERADILYQAILSITDLRHQAGIPATDASRDGIIRLKDVAGQQDAVVSSEQAAAFLDAAEMIRTLRVVVDSGIALKLLEHGISD